MCVVSWVSDLRNICEWHGPLPSEPLACVVRSRRSRREVSARPASNSVRMTLTRMIQGSGRITKPRLGDWCKEGGNEAAVGFRAILSCLYIICRSRWDAHRGRRAGQGRAGYGGMAQDGMRQMGDKSGRDTLVDHDWLLRRLVGREFSASRLKSGFAAHASNNPHFRVARYSLAALQAY